MMSEPDMEAPTQPSGEQLSHIKMPVTPAGPYQYQPLQAKDAIRVAELLPDSLGEPVHVVIHHRTLSALPICSAVSYEWGSNVRDHVIFCDDRALKVTANLHSLLSAFRTTDSSQLLWIDAICINQDDLDERSSQVQLMGKIYSNAAEVLMWLGEATQYTERALPSVHFLAALLRTFTLRPGSSEGDFEPYERVQILDSITKHWLRHFEQGESIFGVGDLMSRDYFSRLWIIQEVVLAPKAVVICGAHRIPWRNFYQAAMCLHILCSDYLDVHSLRPAHSMQVLNISFLGQLSFHRVAHSMLMILRLFPDAQVTDPRDYVYGYLGIFESRSLEVQIPVDYSSTVEDVFQKATEVLIFEEQSLGYLVDQNVEPQSRPRGATLPSWVRDWGFLVSNFLPNRVDDLLERFDSAQIGEQEFILEGNQLTTQALIIDSIKDVSTNLCEANFDQILLQSFFDRLSLFEELTTAEIDRAARGSLVCFDSTSSLRTWPKGEKSFFALLASFYLTLVVHFGLDSLDLDHDARYQTLLNKEYLHSELLSHAFEDDNSIMNLVRNDLLLQWSINQDIVVKDLHKCLQLLKLRLFVPDKSLGVNFFKGSKGFSGHGPGGSDNRDALPAVRVGDHIVLFPTVEVPMIIRERKDGAYTLIGTAHVGNIDEIPFLEGEFPELAAIRLR